MAGYRLHYSITEDRVMLSGDDDRGGAALTRRLTRSLLKTMTNAVGEQTPQARKPNETIRNTVLNFEQTKAVSEAYAAGRARREATKAADQPDLKLATAVDVSAGKTAVLLKFRQEEEEIFSLSFDRAGAYVFISSLNEVATKAGWDLKEIAAWLEPVATPQAPKTPKVLH